MVAKNPHHTASKNPKISMVYWPQPWAWISSLIVVSLPECPLDSSSHCQEQKEVEEWGRDWVMFKASICTELEYVKRGIGTQKPLNPALTLVKWHWGTFYLCKHIPAIIITFLKGLCLLVNEIYLFKIKIIE